MQTLNINGQDGGGGDKFRIQGGIEVSGMTGIQKLIVTAMFLFGFGGITWGYKDLKSENRDLVKVNEAQEKKIAKQDEELQKVKGENFQYRRLLLDVGALLEKTGRSVRSPYLRKELEEQGQKIKETVRQSSQAVTTTATDSGAKAN
jgi:hypothetical protein